MLSLAHEGRIVTGSTMDDFFYPPRTVAGNRGLASQRVTCDRCLHKSMGALNLISLTDGFQAIGTVAGVRAISPANLSASGSTLS